MRNFTFLAILAVILGSLAFVVRFGWLKRDNPGKPINSAMREAMEGNVFSPEDSAQLEKQFPDARKTASGLRYVVRKEGDGPTPQHGSRVSVRYEGRFMDGRVFDGSKGEEPYTFRFTDGAVIQGWSEALATMKRGERRTLIIPFWLGYGANGRGPIPPRATLIFDVELVEVQ